MTEDILEFIDMYDVKLATEAEKQNQSNFANNIQYTVIICNKKNAIVSSTGMCDDIHEPVKKSIYMVDPTQQNENNIGSK